MPKTIKPDYEKWDNGEAYFKNLMTEYQQSAEEGLDVEIFKSSFEKVSSMPDCEEKCEMADELFEKVINAVQKPGYRYREPSELDAIRTMLKAYALPCKSLDEKALEDKIYGAWLGRICGCLLGKPCEGRRADVLIPFLKESDNFPMHRYVMKSDFKDDTFEKYPGFSGCTCFADEIDCAPVDDDTNYTVLAQTLIDRYSRDFTTEDVGRLWISSQPKTSYFTAERVALINLINGYIPPDTAVYKNPYREWIGAQIRGDYFGYINPGNPGLAAEMAYRDARLSHVKNGIYGEMFASAAIASAAVCDNVEDVVRGGLSQIPSTSRLYEALSGLIDDYNSGLSYEDFYIQLHSAFDEYSGHGWCHTISNALIVTAALLYGNGEYGQTICLACQSGFDTDCNAATAGSIIGMMKGKSAIAEKWSRPINGKLATTIDGKGTVEISELVKKTIDHIER